MDIPAISFLDIHKILTRNTKEYKILLTHKDGRARITANLIADLKIGGFNDLEVSIFLRTLLERYIPGALEIEDCYKLYLEERYNKDKYDLSPKTTDTNICTKGKINRTDIIPRYNRRTEIEDIIESEIISIEEAKQIIEKVTGTLKTVDNKDDLFERLNANSNNLLIYAPELSIIEDTNYYGFRLYESIRTIIQNYYETFFVMRLENMKFCSFLWSEISHLFQEENKSTENVTYWRMFIYPEYIKVFGCDELLPVKMYETDKLMLNVEKRLRENQSWII